MKQDITIFQRQTFVSNVDGSAKTYRHDQRLCKALGSSKGLLLYFVGDRQSSADAFAQVKVYQGADPDNRPSDVGDLLEQFVYTFESLRPEPVPITGPYLGKLDITVEIFEAVTPQTTQQEIQFAIYATMMS
jgi:hypothetical protein